jgi:hypothetical protein
MGVAELMGWLAFGLNVWGNLALANLSTSGWIIRLTSNAAWLVYSAYVGAWPLFGNHAVFTLINIHGWRKWSAGQTVAVEPAPEVAS